MKYATLFAIACVGLALTASAQMIDFTNLSATATPTSMPENYAGLSWSGIDYVSPMMYDYCNGTREFGAGFMHGPEAMIAFGGGPMCYKTHGGTTAKNICSAAISGGIGMGARAEFLPVSVIMAAGWEGDGPQSVTVQAYHDGNLMGSQKFDLGMAAEKLTFAFPNWGPVTELKFIPSPGGSFVMYVLMMQD